MILHFTEEPTVGKSYTFYRPLDDDFKPFTATLLQHGRVNRPKDRLWDNSWVDKFWGVLEHNGEKRKAQIDWHGWHDGKYQP